MRSNHEETAPADPAGELAGVVHRNIHALVEVRRQFDERKTAQDRAADAITRFTGSMTFVYLHVFLFGGWILINSGIFGFVKPFDPFPFVMLAMAASVEAIFLSTFVLISQNRSAALSEKRAELDLQISLLSEHEITRLIQMVERIGHHVGMREVATPDVQELTKDVSPEKVMETIEDAERHAS
jgi:uncharacterized membrane protein